MDDPRHLKRGNLLWESSRMFLPEHREQLLERRRRQREFVPPEPDEDRVRQLNGMLGAALVTGRPVAVTVAGTYAPEVRFGRVAKVEPLAGRFRLDTESGRQWVPFSSLLHVEWAAPESAGDASGPAANPRTDARDEEGGTAGRVTDMTEMKAESGRTSDEHDRNEGGKRPDE